MSNSGDWIIPRIGLGGGDSGLNNAGIAGFARGLHLARETCQNIIDAHDEGAGGPPTAEFSMLSLPVKDLPGHERFRKIVESCRVRETDVPKVDEKVADFFSAAVACLDEEEIPVLRIRDWNTTGLTGSDDERTSKYYRLIRGEGRSQAEGDAGGSFGIGQKAPFAFSDLRLVFYSTRVGEEVRFIGKYILCSCDHPDHPGVLTQDQGLFAQQVDEYKVAAVTEEENIPEFFRRDQGRQGTDIYIVGFTHRADWRNTILRSVLSDFYASIAGNHLAVVIREEDEEVEITPETIMGLLEEEIENATGAEKDGLRSALYSIKALSHPVGPDDEEGPFIGFIDNLGRVEFYVFRDDEAPNNVAYMRKPRMKVLTKHHTQLKGYQGVMVVPSVDGNTYLRELEDPGHVRWDKQEATGWTEEKQAEAGRTLYALYKFAQDSLKTLRVAVSTEAQDMPGLDKFLPASDDDEEYDIGAGTQPTGEGGAEEGSSPVPKAKEPVKLTPRPQKKTPSIPVGGGAGGGPEHVGGSHGSSPDNPDPGRPQDGDGGEGGDDSGNIIQDRDVRLRSWRLRGRPDSFYGLAVTSAAEGDLMGDLPLSVVGESVVGRAIVLQAKDADTGAELEVRGGVLSGIQLSPGQRLNIEVEIDTQIAVALSLGA